MSIPVLLDAVVIDADNKVIRIIEGGVTTDVVIVEGTYHLRGDGSAGDLALAVATALTTATGTNVYGLTVVYDCNSDNVAGVVTITRSVATNTWGVQWAATQTTFDPALLGFADANVTPANVATAVSTVTPSCCWVSNCDPADSDPDYDAETYTFVGNDGGVAAGAISAVRYMWLLGLEFIDGPRMHEALNVADPNAALSKFWARAILGSFFEVHLCATLSASLTTLETTDSGTLLGTSWHLHEDSASSLRAARFDRASSLWSWAMRLRKRVT